jgi:hypothetical protein
MVKKTPECDARHKGKSKDGVTIVTLSARRAAPTP